MTAPLDAELDREQRLDEVLAAYLNALRQGSAPSRQQLLDAHPDLADDLRDFFRDQDRFDRLATPLRAALPASPPMREFGDYTDLAEIARGGMGVVFRARQKSLNRRVALKMLLAGPLASADDVQRFRTEAEAAASLAHPHIVPIYEVGTHDGYPYLSMQLLEGGSLAHVAGRPPWLVDGRASAQRVARLLIDIAAAVHYAHQHGILHRDLKPANILLDTAGKAHVSDFGLAKRAPPLAQQASPAAKGSITSTPLPPALTHTGAILGTPAYMAPEQASGERGAVTVAADVYGLGAILYELLTGEAPFRGLTPLATMRMVQEEEPIAPSKRNPRVDRDLETICLKCLHKQAARRYASAEELARDLERYLRGEPIQARPVGALERSWRWCKRQPAVAGLALALLLTLTTAVTLLAALWFRAERHADRAETLFHESEDGRLKLERANEELKQAGVRIEEKRKEAEHAQADADASFLLAHRAVIEFSERFLEDLKQSPGSQPLQKAVLELTLGYFRKFAEQRRHDPALKRELAATYGRIAHITAAIDSATKAADAWKQALALYRELHERDPQDQEVRRELAGALINLSVVQPPADKLATLGQAKETYEAFLRDTPDDEDLEAGLALVLHNLGSIHNNAGRTREGMAYLHAAATTQFALLRKHPNDVGRITDLASTLHNTATILSHQPGQADLALCSLHHAQLLREDLARRFPRDPRRRADVYALQSSAALILRDLGRVPEALTLELEVLAGRQKLADENPSVTRYQLDLAESHNRAGTLHGRKSDHGRARAEYEAARDIFAALLQREHNNAYYRKLLGDSWFNVGVACRRQDRAEDERVALEKSRAEFTTLVKQEPSNAEYRILLARTLTNLGSLLGVPLKRYDDAVEVLKEGVQHSRHAMARAPHLPAGHEMLNSNLGNWAWVERQHGHADRAVALTLERRDLWADNGPELYRAAVELALAAAITKMEGERTHYGDLTLETLRQAKAAGFRDAERLRQEKAFDALRQRDDFKQLLNEWNKTAP